MWKILLLSKKKVDFFSLKVILSVGNEGNHIVESGSYGKRKQFQ